MFLETLFSQFQGIDYLTLSNRISHRRKIDEFYIIFLVHTYIKETKN